MEELCILKTHYGDDCADKFPCSTNRGPARIQRIINASKTYKNSLFTELEHQFDLNPNLSVKCYKLYLLEKCTVRGDQWEYNVSRRVQGALSDLHDEEARYHSQCISRFFANRTIQYDELEASATQTSSIGNEDTALEHVIRDVRAEIHMKYTIIKHKLT